VPSRIVPTRWLVADGAERTFRSRLPVFTVTVAEPDADSGAARAGAAASSTPEARASTASGDSRRDIPIVYTAQAFPTPVGEIIRAAEGICW
jgi:hypothetical protein